MCKFTTGEDVVESLPDSRLAKDVAVLSVAAVQSTVSHKFHILAITASF